jgi:exonuclease VII large subunit
VSPQRSKVKWLQVMAIVVVVIIFVATIIVDKHRDESKRKSETGELKEIVYNPLYLDLKDVEEKAKHFERRVEMRRYVNLLKYERFRLAQMPMRLQSGFEQLQRLLYHYNESFDGWMDHSQNLLERRLQEVDPRLWNQLREIKGSIINCAIRGEIPENESTFHRLKKEFGVLSANKKLEFGDAEVFKNTLMREINAFAPVMELKGMQKQILDQVENIGPLLGLR